MVLFRLQAVIKIDSMPVSVSFPLAVIKYSDKSNLQGKGILLAHSSRVCHGGNVMMARVEAADSITSMIRKQRGMNSCFSAPFQYLKSSGPQPGNVATHSNGFPSQLTQLRGFPQAGLDSANLTVNTNQHSTLKWTNRTCKSKLNVGSTFHWT